MSDYNAWYTTGWEAARRSTELGAAEARFLGRTGQPWNGAAHKAFEDGWLDRATDRAKYHLRDCSAHSDECGREPYFDPWGRGGKFTESGLTPMPDPTCEGMGDPIDD